MGDSRRIGIVGPVGLASLAPHLPGYHPETDGLGAPIITELALTLRARGHDVRVFTLSPHDADLGRFVADGLSVSVGRYRPRHRARDVFRHEITALQAAIRADPPELLHAHWTYEFAVAAMRSGFPTLVTVHDWAPTVLRHHPHPYRVVRLGMQWFVLRTAPQVAANSPYIAARIERRFGRSVPVLPNAIQLPASLPDRVADTDGRLVVGSVNHGFGRLKNVGRLLEAFNLVRRSRPHAILRLVGADFEPGGAAQRWARDRGLDAGVRFEGPLPANAIADFMGEIDVLVHPSLEESFGRTLLEAVVTGTLVVGGSRSGAVPWVLGGGRAGELVDVADPDAIAQAVLLLDEDRASWGVRRRRAFDHARENFSMDAIVRQHESAYRQVLAQR